MTASETLLKLMELTEKNLEILEMINESFFTRREHLTTVVDGTRYTIPSYIALENKVNHLQAAWNNLINAPITGEAYANFDGNSRVIQMRGFQQAPRSIDMTSKKLEDMSVFYTEDTNFFKDMLSPKPYIRLDLSELDDDITQVVIKKLTPYNDALIVRLQELFDENTASTNAISVLKYSDVMGAIDPSTPFKEGEDYAVYDSIYTLPVRHLTCYGEYVVKAIKEDIVDDQLNNIITLQLDDNSPLTYTVYDGFTTRSLKIGDILTTYNGSARLEIIDIRSGAKTLKLRVTDGEYVNILPDPKAGEEGNVVSDYSKLRFYYPADFSSDKYINIPLEEDKYVYIAVAPLNSRMNTQAAWNNGLFINTDNLVSGMDEDNKPFREYYNDNVKNLGDTINELAAILPQPITNLNPTEYASLTTSKPYMTDLDDVIDTVQVVHINKHLNEAENIKTIRNLYSQKQQYKVDLEECQNKIATLTAELAEISFDDMSGSRTMISAQITDLKAQQNELIAAINTAVDAISLAANDSEVPIEDSKFRIRGYVDVDRFINRNGLDNFADNVRAVKIRYRYKNPGIAELANVSTIGENFLFTEWCTYSAGDRRKTASYSNGKYVTEFAEPDPSANDVKYNQIDIPITQGEQVDIQAKIIWDFGYPFITIESDWSDAITVKFPQELAADVQVTTILKENNDDIETYRFENILDNHGITQHASDFIDDQNIRYFHKPESISSGFYTEERRIIPLLDKLKEMNSQITAIEDVLLGTYAESLQVSFNVNNTEYPLKPDVQNVINLTAYNSVPLSSDVNFDSDIVRAGEDKAATTFGTITIKNVTNHTLRIFSMVPGARDVAVTESNRFKDYLNTFASYALGVRIPRENNDEVYSTNSSAPTTYNSPRFNVPNVEPAIDPDTQIVDPVNPYNPSVINTGNATDQQFDPYGDNGDPSSTFHASMDLKQIIPLATGDQVISASTISLFKEYDADATFEFDTAAKDYALMRVIITNPFADTGLSMSSNRLQINVLDNSTPGEPGASPSSEFKILSCGKTKDEALGAAASSGGTGLLWYDLNANDYLANGKVIVYFVVHYKPSAAEQTIHRNVEVSLKRLQTSSQQIKTVTSRGAYYVCTTEEEGITNVMSMSVSPSSLTFESQNQQKSLNVRFTQPIMPEDWAAGNYKLVVDGLEGTPFVCVLCKQLNHMNTECTFEFTGNVSQTKQVKIKLMGKVTGDTESYIELTECDVDLIAVIKQGGGGGNSDPTTTTYYDVDYSNANMVYVLDPSKINYDSDLTGYVEPTMEETLRSQAQNQFILFRRQEPFANTVMGHNSTNVNDGYSGIYEKSKQFNLIRNISKLGGFDNSFVYATPATPNVADLCIQSDAVHSVLELGPGEVLSVPVYIAYSVRPGPHDCSYTLGFDIRNSLYNDPIFYQVTLAARYTQTFNDLLNSQKASTSNQVSYNPVVRS